MRNRTTNPYSFGPIMLAAGLLATPALAQVTTPAPATNPPAARSVPDGTPGNPPSTAVGRAVDRATGTPTVPDGTPGNPAGTAAGRAVGTSPPAPGSTTTTPGTASTTPAAPTPGAPTPARTATTAPGGTTAGAPVSFSPGSVMAERTRMSQVLGSRVYNDRNESIGEVEDVVLHGVAQGPVAVIQVGGFLGLGGRLVAVPLNDLRWMNERIVLQGATKEQLQSRPAFDFGTIRRG